MHCKLLVSHRKTINMVNVLLFFMVLAVASARQFENPVINGDFPDPGVIKYQGRYYAATTNKESATPNRFSIHVSNDLQTWTFSGFALNQPPVWAAKSSPYEFWAPEIHQVGNNDFRIYFTARDDVSGRLCIGAGSSNNVLGPYTVTARPIILDLNQDILDATLVQDGARKFLVWKGASTGWLYGREIASDGLGIIESNPVRQLFNNNLPWEGPVVEAPWYIRRPDAWYMFYSGSGYCDEGYSVGVARSQDPLGPFEKHGNPILVADATFKATGHCSVVTDINDDPNVQVMVYHSYWAGKVCEPNPRPMMSKSVGWGADGWPYMINN